MKKPGSNLFLKPLIGLAVFLFIVLFFIRFLETLAKRSNLFKIKAVIVRENNEIKGSFGRNSKSFQDASADLSYLVGRNIFSVDLLKEEWAIAQIYPEYKKIRLVRILPDRLFVDFIKRRPIAYLKLYRYFYIDEDGVLFNVPTGLLPAGLLSAGAPRQWDLPVILGLEKKIFGPKPGLKYDIRELITAVNIIKAMRSNAALKQLQINLIDAGDRNEISFLIRIPPETQGYPNNSQSPVPNNLEVKIGDGYINDKINILSSLFVQEKKDYVNIKYIDLRFKEPVIKFKEQKK